MTTRYYNGALGRFGENGPLVFRTEAGEFIPIAIGDIPDALLDVWNLRHPQEACAWFDDGRLAELRFANNWPSHYDNAFISRQGNYRRLAYRILGPVVVSDYDAINGIVTLATPDDDIEGIWVSDVEPHRNDRLPFALTWNGRTGRYVSGGSDWRLMHQPEAPEITCVSEDPISLAQCEDALNEMEDALELVEVSLRSKLISYILDVKAYILRSSCTKTEPEPTYTDEQPFYFTLPEDSVVSEPLRAGQIVQSVYVPSNETVTIPASDFRDPTPEQFQIIARAGVSR